MFCTVIVCCSVYSFALDKQQAWRAHSLGSESLKVAWQRLAKGSQNQSSCVFACAAVAPQLALSMQ